MQHNGVRASIRTRDTTLSVTMMVMVMGRA